MPAYTITAATKKKDWQSEKGGPMTTWVVNLTDSSGTLVTAEMNTKATSPEPSGPVEGVVEQTNWGPKFKKAFDPKPFGGGGSSARNDPATQAAIIRQHSQTIAMQIITLQVQAGVIEAKGIGVEFLRLADWLDQDVRDGVKKAMAA